MIGKHNPGLNQAIALCLETEMGWVWERERAEEQPHTGQTLDARALLCRQGLQSVRISSRGKRAEKDATYSAGKHTVWAGPVG